MTIPTPDHWSSETRRFANSLATVVPRSMKADTLGKLELDGLLSIAVEVAELRKVLSETQPVDITATLDQAQPFPAYGTVVLEGARDPELTQTLESLESQDGPEEFMEQAARALERGQSVLRMVGWYCPGGHPLPSKMHSGQSTLKPAEPDMVLAKPNVRFEDPCVYAVPMYVLVKS